MNTYNERLKKLMKSKKVTQRDLANLLNVAQPTINQRLASDKTFDIEDLIKICAHLGMSISEFLYEEETGTEIPASVLTNEEILAVMAKRNKDLGVRLSTQISIVSQLVEDCKAIREILEKGIAHN